MLRKIAFYFLKPLMDRAATEKAREYIDELGRRTDLPSRLSESAKKRLKIYLTFSPYSGESTKSLIKRYLWDNDKRIRYEISAFEQYKYSQIAFSTGMAIRRSVSDFYDFLDSPLIDGFFGEVGKLLLEDLPEIELCSPKEYEKTLKVGEATVRKIRELKNFGESLDGDSLTFEDYLELYKKLEAEISALGFLQIEISPKDLRKIYESGKNLFPFLSYAEMIVELEIEKEKGKILASKNKDKILERKKGLFQLHPKEVGKIFSLDSL